MFRHRIVRKIPLHKLGFALFWGCLGGVVAPWILIDLDVAKGTMPLLAIMAVLVALELSGACMAIWFRPLPDD